MRLRRLHTTTLLLALGIVPMCGTAVSTAPRTAADPSEATTPDGLWIASTNVPSLLRLSPSQLAGANGHAWPTTITADGFGLHALLGAAFDRNGRMWIASQDDSILLAFSPPALARSGQRQLGAIITASARSLSAPVGLAFDARHRLWVANFGNGTLARFDPAQLLADGAPEPAVILTGLARPTALAFDAAGTLWVADMHLHTISAYSADALEASGAPTPRVVLRSAAGSLAGPAALAFDRKGTLWVANVRSSTIVGFDAAQRRTSGAPLPRTTIAANDSASIGAPAGLAFDGAGRLWAVSLEGTVSAFTPTQLAAGGAPAPSVRLTLDEHGLLWGAAFWPTPRGLPLN